MDVGQIPQSLIQKLQKAERANAGSSKAPSTEGSQGADSVSVSSKAKTRHAVRKAYDELPGINQDKVNYFRQQIQDGTYKPVTKEVVVRIFDTFLGQR